MGVFNTQGITFAGELLLSMTQAGTAILDATKLVMGSGVMPAGATVASMTAVVTPVKELAITKKKHTNDGKAIFGGVYSNEGVTSAFYFREFALYARPMYVAADGSKTYGEEVLYAYGNAGDTADLMPAYSTSTAIERELDMIVWVGNEATVNLEITSGVSITREVVEEMIAEITPEGIGANPIIHKNKLSQYTTLAEYLIDTIKTTDPIAIEAYEGNNLEDCNFGVYGMIVAMGTYLNNGVYCRFIPNYLNYSYERVLKSNGTWAGKWSKVYNESNKPTAADIGAVRKTGDTLTGQLDFMNTDSFFALKKARLISTDRKVHFGVIGVGSSGNVCVEHYVGDTSDFNSAMLNGRLELASNPETNSYAIVIRGDNESQKVFRLYGEHNRNLLYEYSTSDLTAGTSSLATGKMHLVYE